MLIFPIYETLSLRSDTAWPGCNDVYLESVPTIREFTMPSRADESSRGSTHQQCGILLTLKIHGHNIIYEPNEGKNAGANDRQRVQLYALVF